MRHLPIACPRCTHRHVVGIRQLDQQLECESCGTPFYVDSGGACVRGRRPAKPAVTNPHRKHAPGARTDPLEVLARIPRGARIAALALALVSVTWLGSRAWIASHGGGVPESLVDRADHVAQAFARGEFEAIAALADPGGTLALDRWYQLKRVPTWPVWRTGPPEISSTVLFRKDRSGTAATISTLQFPARDPDADDSTAGPRLELLIFWTLGDDRLWRIDGTTTVREATRVR